MNSKAGMRTAIGGGIIIFMSFGIQNCFAVVMSSMVEALNTSMTSVSLIGTVCFITSLILSFAAAKLIKTFTFKWSLMLGSIFAGIFPIMYGTATSLPVLYLAAVLSAIPLAIGAHATIAGLVSGWFDSKKSLSIIGILFGIANFGGAAYSFVTGRLMLTVGWSKAMIYLGIFNLVVGVLANLLLVRNPPKAGAVAEAADAPEAVPADPEEKYALDLKQALKTPSFYLFFFGMFFAAMLQAGFQLFCSSFWQAGPGDVTAASAATWLSVIAICGALITMVSGWITNKLGGKKLMIIVFIGYAIGVAVSLLWSKIGGTALILITCIFVAFSYSCNGIPSLVLPELFGRKDYTSINAASMAGFYMGCAVCSVLIGAIVDATGSFNTAFSLLIVFSLIAMILIMLALSTSPFNKARKNSENAKK